MGIKSMTIYFDLFTTLTAAYDENIEIAYAYGVPRGGL